jgi:hypothetical protein
MRGNANSFPQLLSELRRIYIISVLCISGLLMGCSSRSQPHRRDQVLPAQPRERAPDLYSLGQKQEDLRARLSNSCLVVTAPRPENGWSWRSSRSAGGFALTFENSHPGTIVQSCDVYWPGHTNAPVVYDGVRLQYLFFDSNDRLIGFDSGVTLESLGQKRDDLRARLQDSCLVLAASRPVNGWSWEVSRLAGRFALEFENSHAGALVQSCDVYWLGHTNAPLRYLGIRLKYFYFDRNDRLIGSDSWVLD